MGIKFEFNIPSKYCGSLEICNFDHGMTGVCEPCRKYKKDDHCNGLMTNAGYRECKNICLQGELVILFGQVESILSMDIPYGFRKL